MSNWRGTTYWNTMKNDTRQGEKKFTLSWKYRRRSRGSCDMGLCSVPTPFCSCTHFCPYGWCWRCGLCSPGRFQNVSGKFSRSVIDNALFFLSSLGDRKNKRILTPAEICDLLKAVILLVCSTIMVYVDTNMLYHLIKSQSVIKLYIFYNMLEIGDRLFSAFGQDTIDALFWTATEPRGRKREHLGTIPHLLFAIVYVSILYSEKKKIPLQTVYKITQVYDKGFAWKSFLLFFISL